ncbi:MAG TPA: lysozyme [Candidatus Duodenibacillus intestinavium]|nr:lysozyme [Candidatus Duodenibacillus intestinavium]
MNSWGSYDPAIASDFVKQFEGRELKAYRCSAGVWTVGYGHTNGVKEGDEISPAEAEQLLVEDLAAIADDLNRLVNVPVSEGQYIALLSLAFNVGASAIKKSTLLFSLNHGRYEDAAAEFDKWIYAGGKLSEGLKRRRAAERSLFES